MTNALDSLFAEFAEIDARYPGSKKPRRPVPPSNPAQESWDSTPILKKHNGVDTEFFTAGALAKALGKSTVTIRLWERHGHIPQAPYRLPGYTDTKGALRPGKRVYTRSLIEATIEEFSRRDLLGAARVEWKYHVNLTIALVERWNTTPD